MSITCNHKKHGRLGNQIIRNLAMSEIAKRHNLHFIYSSHDLIKKLGINLFVGDRKYKTTKIINDTNYFNIYRLKNINYNLNANSAYFQTKPVMDFLYKYLKSDEVRDNIVKCNPHRNRYQHNNDIYIHIRLGDVNGKNPGLAYYKKCLTQITNSEESDDKIYLSSDSPNHKLVKTLLNSYPNSCLINYDEVETIQFASTCKYIILSHGTFSGIIGYLSYYADKIYYPDTNGKGNGWHPMSVFTDKGWIAT